MRTALGSLCDSWKLCRLADFILSRAMVSLDPRAIPKATRVSDAGGRLRPRGTVDLPRHAAVRVSQGLALAILAWLQTLPEFAVEAVIAWEAGRNPERAHLAIANLTGAIRLLLGLGWPMIYFVFAFSGRRRGEPHLA